MITTTWKDYFIGKGNKITNSNDSAELFKEVSIPSTDRNGILSRLSSDNGNSILIYFSKISKSIELLHSITDLGSNNIVPESKLVALIGLKTNKATPVQIDLDSLFDDVSVHTPRYDRFKTVTDADQLLTLEPPRTNPDQFKHLPFVLLPPILWEMFILSEDRSVAALFLKLIPKLKEIEENNKDNDETNEIASSCVHIAQFLWAANKNLISSVSVAPTGDNECVLDWATTRHSISLPQQPVSHPSHGPPDDRQSIESLSQVISKSFQGFPGSDTSEKSPKGFAKLHESTRNLILNASAQNNEIAAAEPCEDCALFFKTNSHGTARLFILKSLENKFGCNVSIAQGVIMNIYNGNFLRSFDESPSNFSPFSFPKKSLFGKNPDTECLILQLKELAGKGLSNDDVESALKQGVKVPKSIEEMRFSIFNTTAAASFFFSKWSLLSSKLLEVHNHLVRHYTIYEASLAEDQLFTAKFLFAIDTRIQIWLKMCEIKEFREDVDDKLLNFDEVLNQVILRTFNITLPPSIKHVFEKKQAKRLDQDADGPGPKRKKGNERERDEKSSRILNDGKIDSWILSQDQYTNKLRHNSNLKSRPKYLEVPVCHRFHSRGYCFNNCSNKATHIDSTSLPDETQKEYKNWLNSVHPNSD
jgi:hypothetical protein